MKIPKQILMEKVEFFSGILRKSPVENWGPAEPLWVESVYFVLRVQHASHPFGGRRIQTLRAFRLAYPVAQWNSGAVDE